MSKRLDIAGEKYNRLVAVSFVDTKNGASRWAFRCDCGQVVTLIAKQVRFGGTKSCGCLGRELAANRCKARSRHGMTYTPTWNSWASMRNRCEDAGHVKYERYGGRGIKVCERWSLFENFLSDMGIRPAGKTLDRWPNPDGNYEPTNCRWATDVEQRANRSAQ